MFRFKDQHKCTAADNDENGACVPLSCAYRQISWRDDPKLCDIFDKIGSETALEPSLMSPHFFQALGKCRGSAVRISFSYDKCAAQKSSVLSETFVLMGVDERFCPNGPDACSFIAVDFYTSGYTL